MKKQLFVMVKYLYIDSGKDQNSDHLSININYNSLFNYNYDDG